MAVNTIIYIFSFYITTNNTNGKIYYGVHRETQWPVVDDYLGSGKILQQAIQKHGREHFTRKILCVASSAEYVLDIERKMVTSDFIKEDSNYNIQGGGYGSSVCSDSTRKKIGAKAKGRKHTEESKIKMSESRKGKTAPNRTYQKWSNDTRAKQANARKEYWESEAGQRRKAEMSKRRRGKNNHFCGKTHSDETKQTLSNQKKGKKRDPVAVEKTRQKMLGRKHTEETKRKISESMKGNTNRKRPS